MTDRKPLENTLFVQDLRVFSLDASARPADKAHVTWRASFGPFNSDSDYRVQLVIATLAGGSATGHASITVGGLVTPTSPGADVDSETLDNSSALETMYDFAKVGLRQAASAVGVKLKLPLRSPVPELEQIESNEEK